MLENVNSSINEMKRPTQLFESNTQLSKSGFEVNSYDSVSRVDLHTDKILYCGMLEGKTVMRSTSHIDQICLPQESFIMAPGTNVEMRFPKDNKNTSCITIEISKEKIASVAECMNESTPFEPMQRKYGHDAEVLHTNHSTARHTLLIRLLSLFTENHQDRKMLINLSVSELIIRMMRKKEGCFLLSHCQSEPDVNSLTAVLRCIKKNLAKGLSIDELCQIACMSRSRLYYEFKNKLGCSPAELQQQLRLKEATNRLRSGEVITTVCYDLGFSSPSHFSRRFKSCFGCTPTDYRNKYRYLR